MARFHSKELIEKARSWEFPKIHDNFRLFTETLCSPRNFIDFWACYNLISVWMLQCKTWKDKNIKWIAIEPNKSYRDEALYHPKLTTYWWKISSQYFNHLMKVIQENEVKIVLARRVFPEIEENEPNFIKDKLARWLYEAWVEYIVIEWRKKVPNAKAKLSCIETEVYQFIDYYSPIKKSWDIVLLRRNDYNGP